MARQTLTGLEILVVDKDERVRRGLDRLFRDMGLLATPVADHDRARDQLANKFFPVAIIDLDTPVDHGGLELIEFAKQQAPLTALVVMTGQNTFEAGALAFRAGASDVVPKSQDAVPYLRDRVAGYCREVNAKISRDQLMSRMAGLHERFLTEMMEMSKRLVDMEDRVLAREEQSSASYNTLHQVNLLLADDESALGGALSQALSVDRGWLLRVAQSGGEALDAASQRAPHIAVVKQSLPDLPPSMIVSAIKKAAPDVVVLLFSPPTQETVGEVKMVDSSRLITLVPSFTDPAQLVSSLEEIREGLRQKERERRYLRIFRREHLDFLKVYNRVREDLLATGLIKSE